MKVFLMVRGGRKFEGNYRKRSSVAEITVKEFQLDNKEWKKVDALLYSVDRTIPHTGSLLFPSHMLLPFLFIDLISEENITLFLEINSLRDKLKR